MSEPTSARHLATTPVTDDDETIAAALQTVSVPALIASVAVMTGDPSWVRGPIRPRQWVIHELQGMLEEDEKAELRHDALVAICAWRDAGCPPAPPLDPQVLHEIMSWIACEPVPAEYVPLYLEELDLAGEDPRAITGVTPSEDLSVLIIGCGEAGLLAGIRLKQAGIAFEIVEKNSDVGGTWFENSYPGCRVDVPSHFYCYSFESNAGFSEFYTRQPELHQYFSTLLQEHGIAERVRWNREVERAVWDDASGRWQVTTRLRDGSTETMSAPVLISGVGFLNRPLTPDLPGLADFAGPVFHAARWDHSVDLTGTRVALIGAGASGFQIGPAIVDDVESLVVFQRTPQWMSPNPRYHDSVTPGERWAMQHLPGYSRWYRFMMLWQSSDKILELVRIDEGWRDFPQTANELSALRREAFVSWIERHVPDDPELRAKVTPNYPPMSKRLLQDNGSWLRCLTREHVELVQDQITAIDANSITTAAGRYEVDVVVLATGFRASEMLWPMEIIGRDGRSIAEVWEGRPSAFVGVSIPEFPNFFVLNGPGTGLAHAGSVIFMTECQLRYIGDALRQLTSGGYRSIEPTVEAYDRYRHALGAEIATLMWGHPSIEHSWYKAADGGVYVVSPWRNLDYWRMTSAAEPDDHVLR